MTGLLRRFFKFEISIFCLSCFYFLLLLYSCKRNSKSSNGNNPGVQDKDRPNIIFIVADDIGYEIPTFNGGRSYSTPNLDKLAQDGMRFTQCRSSPLCSPSRFMILTGKYNFRNYTTWGYMDQSQRTIGNMLKDAGYTTCYAGKWQLDGGDQSIRTFGFDNYSVWLPYKVCPEVSNGPRYKGPRIYQSGSFFPDSIMKEKYSEDINLSYLMKFIDSNKTKPFFAYYSMMLCHAAFCPTPDDPEYKTWPLDAYKSDPKFFPSMVKYMDKKIGELIDKLNSLGIEDNTIILFIGDNGTQTEITSLFNTDSIRGAKGATIEYGIHVPLVCKWPNKIVGGTTNNDLIDFTDILPTLADIAKIPVPGNYGILDGRSFYPQLTGETGNRRSSIFTSYDQRACVGDHRRWRYSQDGNYKLYNTGEFYRFSDDLFEQKPLPDSTLTGAQKRVKQDLQNLIDRMHN